ncbi:flagellar hook-length control protein FliK [Cohaesibacter celericrescens]|nr:flagellar hook-length control protein FliK [Cohaesibacter celericrescens]
MVSQYSGLIDTIATPSAPAPRQQASRASVASSANFERHLENSSTSKRQQHDSGATSKSHTLQEPVRNDKSKKDASQVKEAPIGASINQRPDPKTDTTHQAQNASELNPNGNSKQRAINAETEPTPQSTESEPVNDGVNADTGLIGGITAASNTQTQATAAQQGDGSITLPITMGNDGQILAAVDASDSSAQGDSTTVPTIQADANVKSALSGGQPLSSENRFKTTTEVSGAPAELETSSLPKKNGHQPERAIADQLAQGLNSANGDVHAAVPAQPVTASYLTPSQSPSSVEINMPQPAPFSQNTEQSPIGEGIKDAPDLTMLQAGVASTDIGDAGAIQQPDQPPAIADLTASVQAPAPDMTESEANIQSKMQTSETQTPPIEANGTGRLDEQTIPKATLSQRETIDVAPTAAEMVPSEGPEQLPTEQANVQTAINSAVGTDTLAQPQQTEAPARKPTGKSEAKSAEQSGVQTIATSAQAQKSQTATAASLQASTAPVNTNGSDGSTTDEQSTGQKSAGLSQPDATASTGEQNKPAPSRAPKGEAFSKMMAQVEGQTGFKDLAMQSDQTIKMDASIPMQGEASTVRLTGMESFTRTGQIPQQAVMANSQALAAQISKFAGKGETRFEIRLDPADLGKVDVRLTIGSDGQTRAHMFVEKSETLDFLMRDQRTLERSLQQSGLTLDKQGMEFSLMDQGGKGQQMAQNGNEPFDQEAANNADKRPVEDVPTPSILEPQHSGAYVATNGLNLVI